jgi:DNA-binding transcriptional MerR regulator
MEGISKNNVLLAGELAREAGVSTDTLRHYERKKVLPKPRRSPNGYRLYDESSLGRVRLIQNALSLGFTLDELAVIFAERDKGAAPCREVRDLAVEKLKKIEERLKALTVLRNELKTILGNWDKTLSTANGRSPLRLLEQLGERSESVKIFPNLLKGRNRPK